MGSGKSTHARMHQENLLLDDGKQTFIVERDQIRMEILGSYWTGIWEDEKKVTAVQHERIGTLLKLGIDVTSSDTNLRDKDVQTLMELAHKAGAEVKFMEFRDVDVETCIKRDKHRDRTVGEDVIRDKYNRFVKGKKLVDLEYKPSKKKNVEDIDFDAVEPYVKPKTGKKTILLDIDGTVANHEGVRSPYDTSKYREDTVHEDVRDVIWALWSSNFDIVVFSGRHEDFREDLEWWLDNNGFPPIKKIIMRERADIRDDFEKLYLFEKYVRNDETMAVHSVFDDRNRVVFNTWRRALGLRCFHVQDGDF